LLVSFEKFLEIASHKVYEEAISMFKCENDVEIEKFLKLRALQFENIAKSRTYLFIDEDDLIEHGNVKIMAYFTIALQTLKIPEEISSNQIKKLDGYSARKGGEKITEISAFLIGQLGKNGLFSEKIDGDEIIESALTVLMRVRKLIGGRIVFVECLDKPELIDFYERNGFKVFRQDPLDKLIQMVRNLE
jgi:hypothetical protein